MRNKWIRTLLAGIGAAVLFGALATTASARNLSASETRVTVTFARLEFSGGFGVTRCNLTVAGNMFARTIPKVLESLVGLITEASIGGCEVGSATVLRETFPWHSRYLGFTGTLPSITGVNVKVVNVAFQIREPVFAITCLGRSTAASPITGVWNREAGGRLTSERVGGTVATSCGLAGTFVGTSNSLTPSVTVTLI